MKPIFTKPIFAYLLALYFCLNPNMKLNAWGFYAHQKINRLAVFCLPPEMFPFFKKHIDYITEHAVDPDKRRYLVSGEGEKHFIDMDHYEHVLPFDTIPKSYSKAVEKYSKDSLHAYGIVPWNIQWMLNSLTEAFASKNEAKILKYAAELGHYIGDAHVPLHVTENYNGQLTNQHGIHGFFETRLPELFSNDFDFFVGHAAYITHPLNTTWHIIEESFASLDSVFLYEKKTHSAFSEQAKFTYEPKGNQMQKVYSRDFSKQYHLFLNGMVERRMRAAVLAIASFWYTAWVNGGQPSFEEIPVHKSDTAQIEILPQGFPGQMLGRQEE
ncbi:MAG: zinc dependent phospholipase C family protein [Bacteroidia bacterium]|nr:zinc dependent phospholipase C family protein [Bacteroidia bacterium]